jgi:hypothetical protein
MNVRLQAWDLLLAVLFADDDAGANRALGRELGSRTMPWTAFVSLANMHLITAPVWEALGRRDLIGHVPQEFSEYLESFRALVLDRNRGLERQLRDCMTVLERRGIQSMPLKGAMYLLLDRPRFVSRFQTDIDLLVPREAARDAEATLLDCGYAHSEHGDKTPAGHHHLKPLVRGDLPAPVELHTEGLPAYARAALPTATLWDNASATNAGYTLPSLSDAAMLAYLHSEIVDRNLARLQVPLRVFYDLQMLAAVGQIDWEANIARAAKLRQQARLVEFLCIFDRMRGRSRPGPLRGGWRAAVRYRALRAVLGSARLAQCAATLDKLSDSRLRDLYGSENGGMTMHALRARRALVMIGKGLRPYRQRADLSETGHSLEP